MENVAPTPIDKLQPYVKAAKIKVRICRIWKSTIPGTVQKYTALHCILLDEMQHAIEACTTEMDYEIVGSKIEAGSCYEIMCFRTNKMRGQYRVVPHDTQVVFNGKTIFKKLSSVFPPIPRHRFFLQDYNTLYPRLNTVDILTDVIGHVTGVQELEPKQINQRIAHKCDIAIENIRKEEMKITLWEDVAETFSSLSMETLSAPTIAVFTSLKVKLYIGKIVLSSTASSLFFLDPDIPELNAYKSVFSNNTEAVKVLAPSSKQVNEAQILQTARRVTVDELAFLDPDLYKDDTFLCRASIKRFDTRYDWWYSACPNCVKQMQKDPASGQLVCQKHPTQVPTPWYKVNLVLEDQTNEISALVIGKSGEKLFGAACKDLVMNQRLVDQRQLQNEFLRLIGQRKNFHLRFGSRKNTFNSTDVLIYNLSDDIDMEPKTPQALLTEITLSSTTVSSSTSTPKTTAQSYKRKREAVRRPLFTGTEQSDVDEMFEPSGEDIDQIPIKLLKKKSSPIGAKVDSGPAKNE